MTVLEAWLRKSMRAIFTIRPVQRVWEWIDEHVRIPQIVGSVNPGPLDTSLLPFWRGIWDLYWRRKTRFITIMASARVGKTLFAICCLLHKIAMWPGPSLWVDPSRKTATRFSRGELQPHIYECAPVDALAVKTVKLWTTLEMQFVPCSLGLIGSGSAAEAAGRQAELLVLNESDKLKHDIKAEASIHELALVRTKQFRRTRKIVEESTPTESRARIYTRFLEGSQHHVYLPCPCCGKKARVHFFGEEKEVPWDDDTKFDRDGYPIGERVTSIEKTFRFQFKHCKREDGTFDLERVERETNLECGYCAGQIPQAKLNWMLRHYELRAHNLKAPEDHISVHVWAALSPFESWGGIAKKFLQARGSMSRMHDFYNSDLGLPFVRHATEIKDSDLDVVVKMSPDYALRTLPRRPILLTMTVDVQGDCFWWSIRAWGLIEEMPEIPIWSALIDYGSAVAWDQIEELAAIKADPDGKWNEYLFDGEAFRVTAGLIDSGFEAQKNKKVYEFCLRNSHVFSPSKGGGWQQLRGMTIRQSPVFDDQLELIWYEDAAMKQQLYYHCIKEHKENWWLPRDIEKTYRNQLTGEQTVEEKQNDGTMKLVWKVTGPDGNHLADTEKEHEALRPVIEPKLQEIREDLLAARKKSSGDTENIADD